MMHNDYKRECIVKNEYWMQQSDIEQLEKFRDILYCKYAIRETTNNRNCNVDMRGVASWGKQLDELRKDFIV